VNQEFSCKNSFFSMDVERGRLEYIGLNGKFLRFRRDGVSKPRSFYKAGIEKLVTRWETVIASNGSYIID
jgi:hypothetical protein